jgi:hypothetical protein
MPPEEEREEMNRLDRKLDAFAALLGQQQARLNDSTPAIAPGGGFNVANGAMVSSDWSRQ